MLWIKGEIIYFSLSFVNQYLDDVGYIDSGKSGIIAIYLLLAAAVVLRCRKSARCIYNALSLNLYPVHAF